MTAQDIIRYWQDTSAEDFATAEALFASKHYANALFFCHLSIEKLIKGLIYVKTDQPPLPIHNLNKLLSFTQVPVPKDIEEYLHEISRWNIEARYDSFKREFYRKATRAFTEAWIRVCKEVIVWLKNQY